MTSILDPATARKRFFLWLALRLAGLAALGLGAWVARGGDRGLGLVLLIGGALTLLLRPKHLGLTGPKRG